MQHKPGSTRAKPFPAATPAPDDAPLVRSCLQGDPGAWKALVDRYARLVYSLPRSYGLPDDICEDTCQEVFQTVFRGLGQLADVRSLTAWITRITHRATWRQARALRRRRPSEPMPPVPMRDPLPEVIEAWARRHQVDQALRQLGGRCEELLRLLFLDPSRPTYESIASRLGVPIGSIGAWRGRCLKSLLQVLNTWGQEEPARDTGRVFPAARSVSSSEEGGGPDVHGIC